MKPSLQKLLLVPMVAAMCFIASPVAYGDAISVAGSLNSNDANDVFLFPFALAGTDLRVQTFGDGGTGNAPGGTNAVRMVISDGGFDPYLTLFRGTGPNATFFASNDDGLCPPGAPAPACEDSTLMLSGLAQGAYTLALTVFDNFSFAENLGTGTLGDGFIGLGDYFDQASGTARSPNFAFDISSSGSFTPAPVPEPQGLVLTGTILIGAWLFMRKKGAQK